jgi:hypothetical protein
MKDHADINGIWDLNQMGTCSSVLGTVDQLLIDNTIMEEIRSHHRNLAVAYYDYQKAYDMVRHDWMLKVYKWMKLPSNIIRVLTDIMSKWMTRLEVSHGGNIMVSRWINIRKGFLQGDSYSPVGFCLTEIPVAMMLMETDGYMMGPPGNRKTKRTHSLFIDDLKVYQESHRKLQIANDIIVQASLDTGACYGVKKCAEMVFRQGKMVKGDGLPILEERMKALDPAQNEVYKFLGCEQAEVIDKDRVIQRVKAEIEKRTRLLVGQQLKEKNLMRAINSRVIPVAGYIMNVVNLTKKELDGLDKVIKGVLRENQMHGRQASDERLYMHHRNGGRGLKSMRDVYQETKVRVACYMIHSESDWIKEAWAHENRKEGGSLKAEVELIFESLGRKMEVGLETMKLDGESLEGTWKDVWWKLKAELKENREAKRKEDYEKKPMQAEIYKQLNNEKHLWLDTNIDPQKVSAIINMQEQMVETKSWKKLRGLEASAKCRLCGEMDETVVHLLSGCTVLAGKEYLTRHNNALKVVVNEWMKQEGMIPADISWYKMKLDSGSVVESISSKMSWDFEYRLRKESRSRRPDATLECKNTKSIKILDMACPNEKNRKEKHREKLQKYQQLCFETREKRPGYKVEMIPLVVGCLGGGITDLEKQVQKIIVDEQRVKYVCREMQKTVLFESETILRKVLSGLVQPD